MVVPDWRLGTPGLIGRVAAPAIVHWYIYKLNLKTHCFKPFFYNYELSDCARLRIIQSRPRHARILTEVDRSGAQIDPRIIIRVQVDRTG